MYKILVTGFEPFAGLDTNVSETVAKSFNSKIVNVDIGEALIGCRKVRSRAPLVSFHTDILTVDYNGSTKTSDAILSGKVFEFDAIIHLGLAREALLPRIETRGLNMNQFSSPDNLGRIANGVIVDGGPSEIPVTASLNSLEKEILQCPFEYSNDAGGFVCNETLYNSLYALQSIERNLPCIFIHLPPEKIMTIDRQIDFVSKIAAVVVQPPHIDVVGAIFEDNGKWLASKRSGPPHTGKWEFAGGKIEQGETEIMALVRECKEELDWDVNPVHRMMIIDHKYPSFTVTIHFWKCTTLSRNPPEKNSHSEHRWIKTSSLLDFDWLDADIPLIEFIQSESMN